MKAQAANAHDFRFTAIEGGELPLARFKGQAVLVVNTASQCGFTPQYEGLQALWQAARVFKKVPALPHLLPAVVTHG